MDLREDAQKPFDDLDLDLFFFFFYFFFLFFFFGASECVATVHRFEAAVDNGASYITKDERDAKEITTETENRYPDILYFSHFNAVTINNILNLRTKMDESGAAESRSAHLELCFCKTLRIEKKTL